MFRRRRSAVPPIDSLLGGSTRIQGDLLFCGGLHLDGAVAGSVKSSGAGPSRLVIGESAVIEGSVVAPIVELYGVVRGDIIAPGRVALGPKARVEGNVHYGALEVAAGASIKGKLVKLEVTPKATPEPENPGGKQ
jgi:cytoskeletal protein CcmA (bactofilin family)